MSIVAALSTIVDSVPVPYGADVSRCGFFVCVPDFWARLAWLGLEPADIHFTSSKSTSRQRHKTLHAVETRVIQKGKQFAYSLSSWHKSCRSLYSVTLDAMKRHLLSFFFHSVFLVLLPSTSALSTGAASCGAQAGMAAVSGSHVVPAAVSGELEAVGFELQLNGYKISPGKILTMVDPNVSYKVGVTGGSSFRGVLIRIEASDEFYFTADANTQEATVCTGENVAGITHTNNELKTTATGDFVALQDQDIAVSNFLGKTRSKTYVRTQHYPSCFTYRSM